MPRRSTEHTIIARFFGGPWHGVRRELPLEIRDWQVPVSGFAPVIYSNETPSSGNWDTVTYRRSSARPLQSGEFAFHCADEVIQDLDAERREFQRRYLDEMDRQVFYGPPSGLSDHSEHIHVSTEPAAPLGISELTHAADQVWHAATGVSSSFDFPFIAYDANGPEPNLEDEPW